VVLKYLYLYFPFYYNIKWGFFQLFQLLKIKKFLNIPAARKFDSRARLQLSKNLTFAAGCDAAA
jgi:hypothetical protein